MYRHIQIYVCMYIYMYISLYHYISMCKQQRLNLYCHFPRGTPLSANHLANTASAMPAGSAFCTTPCRSVHGFPLAMDISIAFAHVACRKSELTYCHGNNMAIVRQ